MQALLAMLQQALILLAGNWSQMMGPDQRRVPADLFPQQAPPAPVNIFSAASEVATTSANASSSAKAGASAGAGAVSKG